MINKRQERFIEEYMKDFHITNSALRAGYSKRSARQQGSALMSNPYIKEEIDKRIKERKLMLERVLMKEAETAKDVMLKILNDPKASERTKVAIAKDILDRAGFKATEKQEMNIEGTMSHNVANVEERMEKYERIYQKVHELEQRHSTEESDTTSDDIRE